jgi:ATP:cob(I)alamin adenosyltransferase
MYNECAKTSERFEALGAIDTLITFIGNAKLRAETELHLDYQIYFETIQNHLFQIASEVSGYSNKVILGPNEFSNLSIILEDIKANTTLPKGFIVSATNELSSRIDLCRVFTREAERVVLRIPDFDNRYAKEYLNLLSTYFYIAARNNEDKFNMINKG